jgi:ubiquinone/menaquinone biosynthesis C-methylase UbiE
MSFHFAWRLLYGKLSFLFDFASDCISDGRWKRWGRTSISYAQGRRVLELGHGPGHLLLELKRVGFQPTGTDLSRDMGRLAARRLRKAGMEVPLVRCRMQILPFRSSSFDTVLATFPTRDILEPSTLREVARVLPQGGRLTMVVGAHCEESRPNQYFIEWLKELIGQTENGRDETVFARAGFRSRIEYQSVETSQAILFVAEKRQRLDGRVNTLPVVHMSSNIKLLSKDMFGKVIEGRAKDPDGDRLTYMWLKGQTAVTGKKEVREDGHLFLKLSDLSPLEIGQHDLTLVVSDPYEKVTEKLCLIIENSPPAIMPMGEVTTEAGNPVTIEAYISDYDGDLLHYCFLEERTVLASGKMQTEKGGNRVRLTETIANLAFGVHMVELQVTDTINTPVIASMEITITDTTPPRLSPVADRTVLWPPDHNMARVLIHTHVSDNSGLPVMLNAFVSSNEPETGLGEWDIGPDWNVIAIDPVEETIALDLRAERSEQGSGRKYTVEITATDQAGNVATAKTQILVPRDHIKLNSPFQPT